MAEEATKEQMVEEAALLAETGKERGYKPRKYKRTRKDERFDEGTELAIGNTIIVSITKGMDRAGYWLAKLIAIDDSDAWWSSQSRLIVHVLEGSNEAMSAHVGEIRIVNASRGWGSSRELIEIGKKNWPNYKKST